MINNIADQKKLETKVSVSYSDNPNKKLKTVVTVDGTTEYLRNCKLIGDSYYRVDDQCVFVDKRWFPINSPYIFFDYETKQYKNRIKVSSTYGVVAYENGSFKFGDYTSNPYYNCKLRTVINGIKETVHCMNYNIVKELGFIEHINEPVWVDPEYQKKNVSLDDILSYVPSYGAVEKILNIYGSSFNLTEKKVYKFAQNSYNAEDSNMFKVRKNEYDKFKTIITKDVRKAAQLIGDVTFGTEIETKLGNLPDYYLSQLGVVICKDGSIGYTPEFVTVPYSGAKGLQSLKNLFIELNKRCTTDYTCSLHYHIGTIRRDREFIVALFRLYSDIQNDLHRMLPYYKTNPEGVKDKNYCKFLNPGMIEKYMTSDCSYQDKVTNGYKSIFNWILEGRSPDKHCNRKNKKHPNGTQKWSHHARYSSINFMNMFMSERNTVEFRGHHAILHPDKAINWFFICVAIVRYAENNSSKILNSKNKIKLIDILNYYGDTFKTEYARNVSKYLIEYYNTRVQYFIDLKRKGDIPAKDDYNKTDYEFIHNGMRSIY
jgi:hypothetical protein